MMSTSAVSALLSALRTVSNNALVGVASGVGSAASGGSIGIPSLVGATNAQSPLKLFALERMTATLSHNLHSMSAMCSFFLSSPNIHSEPK